MQMMQRIHRGLIPYRSTAPSMMNLESSYLFFMEVSMDSVRRWQGSSLTKLLITRLTRSYRFNQECLMQKILTSWTLRRSKLSFVCSPQLEMVSLSQSQHSISVMQLYCLTMMARDEYGPLDLKYEDALKYYAMYIKYCTSSYVFVRAWCISAFPLQESHPQIHDHSLTL